MAPKTAVGSKRGVSDAIRSGVLPLNQTVCLHRPDNAGTETRPNSKSY